MDAHKNLAISNVATPPSPATSGTSLVVTAGHGSRFPAVPFNAFVVPAGAIADPTNAEVVRVTAISTDTFTITRAQESSTARAIVIGDMIFAGVTNKTLTDIELFCKLLGGGFPRVSGIDYSGIGIANAVSVTSPTLNQMNAVPFLSLGDGNVGNETFDQAATYCTTALASAKCRVGIYNDGGAWSPGSLNTDLGQIDLTTGSGTRRSLSISLGLPQGIYWLAGVIQGANSGLVVSSIAPPLSWALSPALGRVDLVVAPTGNTVCWTRAGVSGGLPDPFGGAIAAFATSAARGCVPVLRKT